MHYSGCCCSKSRCNVLSNWYKTLFPVVTLSIQDKGKVLKQLKYGFRSTVNWSKYQSKVSAKRPNQYLDYLIESIFQGINKLFVLSFEDNAYRTSYELYFLMTVDIKDCKVLIDEKPDLINQLQNI